MSWKQQQPISRCSARQLADQLNLLESSGMADAAQIEELKAQLAQIDASIDALDAQREELVANRQALEAQRQALTEKQAEA